MSQQDDLQKVMDKPHLRETLYHVALLLSTNVSFKRSNQNLKGLLIANGSFENAYNHFNLFPVEDLAGIDSVISRLSSLDFNYRIITVNDPEYPAHLREIDGVSPVLYARGDIGLLNTKSMGVVGTRGNKGVIDADDHREGCAVVKRLIAADYTIVSGLAFGCDTLAHQYAVENSGSTIAVIGTPLSGSSPRQNRDLQERIAQEHLLVSQFPVGMKTYPGHFAERNLTTVSLSTDGIVVIRADDKSGTMHAVKHCVQQGKPLYVLANNMDKGYEWVEKNKDRIKVPNACRS